MKKITLGLMSLFFIFGMFALASPAQAAKTTCATIQGGTITDVGNNPISVGYDQWGYNYQAHMFNGWYDNNTRPTALVTTGDWLQMKWNNAWLSNQDCDGDKVLDRHLGLPRYIGSGAWLTNHASGTYESTDNYHWDVSGVSKIAVNGGAYNHDYTFTMTSLPDGTFTGVGGYPAGAIDYSIDEIVINGQITGDAITFTAVYYVNDVPNGYSWTATGTIDGSGNMSGTGTSGVSEWHNILGSANKVMDMCTWSDFVKIVAVPADAEKVAGIWYSADGAKIGPDIWGEFAIIQEVSSNPCGGAEELGLDNLKSDIRAGLGNW